MRSRYLANDYFSSLPSSARCFPFPPLPAPDPPPPTAPPPPHAFDLLPDPHLSPAIDHFPIEKALDLFLADAVPQAIPPHDPIEIGEEADAREGSGSYSIARGDSEVCGGLVDSGTRGECGILEFEVVETAFNLRCDGSSGVEDLAGKGMRISVDEIPMDTSTAETGSDIPYPSEIVKSLCVIEDIPLEVDLDGGSRCSGAVAGMADRTSINSGKLLLFEVSEVGLHVGTSLSTKEVFDSVVPLMGNCSKDQDDETLVNFQKSVMPMSNNDFENLACLVPNEHMESKSICLRSLLEMDLINLEDNVLVDKSSAIYPLPSAESLTSYPCSIHLQETQILDLSHSTFYEIFGTLEATGTQVQLEVFKDDILSAGELYADIVSSELALGDETFISLPTPVFTYDNERISPSFFTETVLKNLSPHPISACDGIYLDWHLLLDNNCGHGSCYVLMNALLEICSYGVDIDIGCHGEVPSAIDLDFLEDMPVGSTTLQDEKATESNSDGTYLFSDIASSQIVGNENSVARNASESTKISNKKVSSLFQSMSQSSDLNYFINARRGTSMEDSNKEKAYVGASSSYKDPILIATAEVNFKKWDVEVYRVDLPDHFIVLLDSIYKDYLGILLNDKVMRGNNILFPNGGSELPSRKSLVESIKGKIRNDPDLILRDDDIALYGIRNLSYFLCAFGILSAYLYLSNICQRIEYLSGKLRNITSLLGNAWMNVKNEAESHPCLSVIENILKVNPGQNGRKILIVANRAFWLPLRRKLSSMKISYNEARPIQATLPHMNKLHENEFMKEILEALQNSDCLLVSYTNLFDSFPFSKFSIIIEYGALHESSTISNFSTKEANLPKLFFLKTTLDDRGSGKALSEGFDVSQHHDRRLGDDTGTPQFSATVKGSMDNHSVLQLLDFVPDEDTSDDTTASESKKIGVNCDKTEHAMSMPSLMDAKVTISGSNSFPDTVVVVNTQTSKKEMLTSRRSSYQKILALEKDGVQVAERDIDLPVDLVFSAAICLVWYDAHSLGKSGQKASGNASISMFTENIATDVLMALSYAFSSCILVFEGENSFLAAVMDSSDTIYAAAASLDMRVQLLYSYSPEITDEIILNCIKRARNTFGSLYPPMPESETLAESFLTRFPSINSLSAHAILQSGGTLVDFLEWSHERRVRAIGKYHIPDESMVLFSTLCKYGEHGDSKSVMTDCSSIDSEINSGRMHLQNKRPKYEMNNVIDLEADDLMPIQPPRSLLNDDIPSKLHRFNAQRDHFNFQETTGGVKSSTLAFNPDFPSGKSSFNISTSDYLFQPEKIDLHKDFNGEVIDHDFLQPDDDFMGISQTPSFSRKRQVASGDRPSFSRLGPHHASRSSFMTSLDVNHYTDGQPSGKNRKNILEDNVHEFSGSYSQWDPPDFKWKPSLPVCGIEREFPTFPGEGKNPEKYSEKPSATDTRASQSRRGIPSTIDFINRMKEKARVPSQSLTCNTCLNCATSQGSKKINAKTLSPSFIDTFRYEGGSRTKTPLRGKQQARRSRKSSKGKTASPTIASLWTPVDKRARQKLSFIRNGNEKQSKLVWTKMNISTSECGFRKSFQDDT